VARLQEELRHHIHQGHVTCIVGPGVTISAALDPSRKPDVASRRGLLEHGVERCLTLQPSLATGWANIVRAEIASDDVDDLLSAAEKITRKLGGPEGGEFRIWLRETVGSLRIRHPRVPAALRALGIPLLTTNYDEILKEATNLPVLTWRDRAEVERVLRGEDRAIIHLHGYWRRPETVLLGVRSYEGFLRDEHAQTVERVLRTTRTLLFLGFDGGVDDPDFAALLRWTREIFHKSEYRHYRLVRDEEETTVQARHPPEERIFALPYGANDDDLACFLESLAPQGRSVGKSASTQPSSVGGGRKTPRPRVLVAGPFFGVPPDLRAEIDAMWRNAPRSYAGVRIAEKLRRQDVAESQIAAIARHDVIVDVSPWRAFSRWWSIGFRDAENADADTAKRLLADGTPLGFCAFQEGDLPEPDDMAPKGLAARIAALDETWSWLHNRIQELVAASGLSVSGLDARAAWWYTLAPLAGQANVLCDRDLPDLADERQFRATRQMDGGLREVTLQDYLRVLQVVAGQVRLSGEERERPIERVFVAMEVHRAVTPAEWRRRGSGPHSGRWVAFNSETARPERGEVDDELAAREQAARLEVAAELLDAEGVAYTARRVVVWGAAGTGKSTLLKWVACKLVGSARTPVWIDRQETISSNTEDQLARLALRSVLLPETPSAAREQLREAIIAGKAHLLLDGLDEAAPAVQLSLPSRVAALGTETRAVIASRPVPEEQFRAAGFVPVTLVGLQGGRAEQFLQQYFGDATWITELVKDLWALPSGEVWSRTPVLLSMAAALCRRDRALPQNTLELYRSVVDGLIRRAAERWGVEPAGPEVAEARAQMRRLAQEMLLPRSGEPRLAVLRRDVEPFLLASGLFTGGASLRFAHLTLGELLAAEAELDLEQEVVQFRTTGRPALEVLPMALALRGNAALEQVLVAAEAGDTWDHRLLGLVLRAAALGGDGATSFGKVHASRVLKRIVERLTLPSGRFAEAEQRLMEQADRAFRVLAVGLLPRDREVLMSLLEGKGAIAAEAMILAQSARLGSLTRPPSDRRAMRLGVALARTRAKPTDVIEFTAGEDHRIREAAVRALASDRESIPLLREALRDTEWSVRVSAINALASDSDSVPLLREALRDPDENVRVAAVKALSSDTSSKPLLRQALRDPFYQVRAAAVTALSSHPESNSLLRQALRDSDPTVRTAAVAALAADMQSRSLLREVLRDKVEDVRAAAVVALSSDVESKPLLREALHDDDATVRAAAVVVLSSDPESRSSIRSALRDDDDDVRIAAIEALMADRDSESFLRGLLSDRDSNVRATAVRALSTATEFRHCLRGMLCDPDPDVRAVVIDALSVDPYARPVLRGALEDPDLRVRAAAVSALSADDESRPLLRNALCDAEPFVRAVAVAALQFDDEAKNQLRTALRDPDLLVRVAAVGSLSGDADSRSLIQEASGDSEWRVRVAAVNALSADPALKAVVREALRDPEWRVREASMLALSTDPASRSLLHKALRCPAWRVREAAFKALSLDAACKPQLRKALCDTREDVRAAAVLALSLDAESMPRLRESLRDPEWRVRVAAVEALSWDLESVPQLREALRDSDWRVRTAALRALSMDAESRTLLREALRDPELSVRAAAFSVLLSGDESADDLQKMLRDPSPNIRSAAINLLASHQESKPLLRRALQDSSYKVRATAVAALSSDPESRLLLRHALRDPFYSVRNAATAVLRPAVPPQGYPVRELPQLQSALRVVRQEPHPAKQLSPEAVALEERLAQFLQAPRPIRIDRDPALAEIFIAWLCVRLVQTTGTAFRLFGETQCQLDSLFEQSSPIMLRISMSAEDLPVERSVLPLHNLVEAWRVARFLQTERDIIVWLVCADLDFADLIPPTLDEPGAIYWQPPFFGFRLPAPTVPSLDPCVELLTSISAERRWNDLSEQYRATILQTLGQLAQDPETDPWALIPLLARVGSALPSDLRAILAQRLPEDTSKAATSLERARNATGAAFRAHSSPVAPPPQAFSPAQHITELCDRIDRALQAIPPDVYDAVIALEQVVLLTSADVLAAELDEIVLRLDRIRQSLSVPDRAQRLLAYVPMLATLPLPLPKGAREVVRTIEIARRLVTIASRLSVFALAEHTRDRLKDIDTHLQFVVGGSS